MRDVLKCLTKNSYFGMILRESAVTKVMFGWHNAFTYQHGLWSSQSFGFSNHSESALPPQWLDRSVLSFWPTSVEQVFHLCSAYFFLSSIFISRSSDLLLFREAFSEIEEEEGRKNHFYFWCSQQQYSSSSINFFYARRRACINNHILIIKNLRFLILPQLFSWNPLTPSPSWKTWMPRTN